MYPPRILHRLLIANRKNTLRPKRVFLHKIVDYFAVESRSERSSRFLGLDMNVQPRRRQNVTECAARETGCVFGFEFRKRWGLCPGSKKISKFGMYFQCKVHRRLQIKRKFRIELVSGLVPASKVEETCFLKTSLKLEKKHP